MFDNWVCYNFERFMAVLRDGERLVGEWLAQAHGTRYNLIHEPFVAFDLMVEDRRLPYDEFIDRIAPGDFTVPMLLHRGDSLGIQSAMHLLGGRGHHGAIDPPEGCIWRVERDRLVDRHSGRRKRVVDFLVKYVRPDKVDGYYLESVSGEGPVWNWRPGQ